MHGKRCYFSLQYGAGDREALKRSTFVSLVLIGFVTLVLNVSVFVWIDPILRLLHVPENVYPLMRDYLWVIFWGIGFTFSIIITLRCCGHRQFRCAVVVFRGSGRFEYCARFAFHFGV